MPLQSQSDTKSKHAAAAPGGADTFVPSLRNDDDKFVRKNHVSIFDAHDGQEEGLDIDFTPAILQKIVDQNNERVAKGAKVPITIGHTGDDEEPEIVGWASNFTVDDFQNTKAIYCDMQFLKEKYARVEELAAGLDLPRRSIELWHDFIMDPITLDKPLLDTVALLGAERPARDLPQEKFHKRNTSGKVKYSIQPAEVNKLDETVLKQLLETVAQLPEFQWCREQMEASKTELSEEEVQSDEAGDGEVSEAADEPASEEKSEMQHEQTKRRYAKLESEYKAMFAKIQDLERKERVATRKAALLQVEAEGYVFDLPEELEIVADLEPAKFESHIGRMKKNYKKAPIGFQVQARPGAEQVAPETPASPHDVMRLAAAKASEKYAAKGGK